MSSNLFEAGEYAVRLTDVVDMRLPPVVHPSTGRTIPSTGKAYGVWHVPTGVLNATTQLLPAAICACYQLNDQLKEAREDPGAEKPGPAGFG